jgi:hypothetical protein
MACKADYENGTRNGLSILRGKETERNELIGHVRARADYGVASNAKQAPYATRRDDRVG